MTAILSSLDSPRAVASEVPAKHDDHHRLVRNPPRWAHSRLHWSHSRYAQPRTRTDLHPHHGLRGKDMAHVTPLGHLFPFFLCIGVSISSVLNLNWRFYHNWSIVGALVPDIRGPERVWFAGAFRGQCGIIARVAPLIAFKKQQAVSHSCFLRMSLHPRASAPRARTRPACRALHPIFEQFPPRCTPHRRQNLTQNTCLHIISYHRLPMPDRSCPRCAVPPALGPST